MTADNDRLVRLIKWMDRSHWTMKIACYIAFAFTVLPLGLASKSFAKRWDAAIYKSLDLDPALWE